MRSQRVAVVIDAMSQYVGPMLHIGSRNFIRNESAWSNKDVGVRRSEHEKASAQ